MDTSSCYLVVLQIMQIMIQWTDDPGEKIACMRTIYVQHIENFHKPRLALLLDAMDQIWKLSVLKPPHELLGIYFHFKIDASSIQFCSLYDFPTDSCILAAENNKY